jgi:hypothetical protein
LPLSLLPMPLPSPFALSSLRIRVLVYPSLSPSLHSHSSPFLLGCALSLHHCLPNIAATLYWALLVLVLPCTAREAALRGACLVGPGLRGGRVW